MICRFAVLFLLATSVTSGAELTFSWTDNAENETGFIIRRAKELGNFQNVATVGKDVTTYRDTDLEPGVRYSYRVAGYNTGGPGEWSDIVSATTKPVTPPPAKPTNPKLTAPPDYEPEVPSN